jgi:hypothetical protein
MTQESLLYVMAAAVSVSALALILQAAFLFVMARAAKAIKMQLDRLSPKAESALESAERTLEQSRKQITDVTTKASSVLESARTQVQRTDEFLADATNRARVQLDRVELVLDDTVSRVHETIVILNDGLLRPLREINGVTAGVRSALAYLLRGGRPNVAQATTDEEMFI